MRNILPGVLMLALMLPAYAAADEHLPEQESELAADPAPPPAAEVSAGKFKDNVSWLLMTSGYYMFNVHRIAGPYNAGGYPYTQNHGFALNFAGADASYMTDKWGLTINLRYGSGAPLLTPLVPLKQGFLTWMPREKLTLDMGWFDTIYGAEVADEWQNVNYSRGALYFLRQPFNHAGLRIGYAASDKVGLTFMATNAGVLGGTPTTTQPTTGGGGVEVPAFGWQVSLAPIDDLALIIGANHAPNGANGNKDWEHFIDIVLTYNWEDLAIIFNADFTISPDGPNTGTELEALYGFSLAALYAINAEWSAGLRVEFLDGNNDANPAGYLVTVTPTVRYSPLEYLIFSLEPRLEFADSPIFFTRDSPTVTVMGDDVLAPDEDIFFAIILGATAKIGN